MRGILIPNSRGFVTRANQIMIKNDKLIFDAENYMVGVSVWYYDRTMAKNLGISWSCPAGHLFLNEFQGRQLQQRTAKSHESKDGP